MGAGAARTDGYPVSMRAASYIGDHKFEFQNRECPDPASGEVRVQLEACGICGSDLHLMHAGLLAVGHTPGHEMAGRIEARNGRRARGALGCTVRLYKMRIQNCLAPP